MNYKIKKYGWSVLSTLVAIGTSIITKKSLEKSWHKTTKTKAPKTPTDRSIDWKQAIAWAVISGMVVSVTKLVTTKLTHDGWLRLSGESPDKY